LGEEVLRNGEDATHALQHGYPSRRRPATSKSYGHARHERTDTGDFWHIYAIYEHEHVRAPNRRRISKIKMTPKFQEGNPKLLDETFCVGDEIMSGIRVASSNREGKANIEPASEICTGR
jgi:hypothetical protein